MKAVAWALLVLTASTSLSLEAQTLRTKRKRAEVVSNTSITEPNLSMIPLCTDFNRDGAVNSTDDQFLLQQWESSGSLDLRPQSDLDADGVISVVDLAIAIEIRRQSPATPSPELCGSNSCVTSSSSFQFLATSHSSTRIRVEYDAKPSALGIDGVMMLGNREGLAYSDYGIRARFSVQGQIQARNGDSLGYQSLNPMTYQAATDYHFRFDINLGTQSYSLFVAPAGGQEVQIARDYAFSALAGPLNSVSNLSYTSSTPAGFEVCGLQTTELTTSEPVPPAAPSNLVAQLNASNAQVTLNWSDNSSNESRFDLERVHPSGSRRVTQVSANANSFVDVLDVSGTYTYSLKSVNEVGASSASNSASIIYTVVVPPSSTNEVCSQTLTTLAALNSAINSAAAGAVLCIPRGTVLSGGGLTVTNLAPTPTNRIVVCSSSNGRCSSTGAANARINSQGSMGLRIRANVDGFIFRNIDFYGPGDYGLSMNENNIQYITFDGGRFDGYSTNGCNPWLNTVPCRFIDLGTLGNPLNFSNSATNGFYGWLEDSYVRITGLNNGSPHNYFHHIFYLSSATHQYVMRNITFEGGEYVANGATPSSWGMFLNLTGNTDNLVIRNNRFIGGGPNDSQASCEFEGIDIATGSDLPTEVYTNTKIYQNYFRTNCLWDINIEFPGSYKVYNNVFDKRGIYVNNDGSILHVALRGATQPAQVEFMNNTIYSCGASNCPTNLFWNSGNSSAVSFFNNLVFSLKSSINQGALFEGLFSQANNHIYLPNSGVGVNPQIVDPANGNFRPLSSSPLRSAGRAVGSPTLDYLGTTRANPPSIGAYEN